MEQKLSEFREPNISLQYTLPGAFVAFLFLVQEVIGSITNQINQ